MEILTWTVVACVFSVLFYYLFFGKKKHNFEDWGIPCQKDELPFVGSEGKNLYKIFFKKLHLTDLFKEFYELNRDAKYVGLHSFNMDPVIIARDLDFVKTILVKDFDHFTDRLPDNSSLESTDPMFAKNVAVLKGDRWREIRNLLSPAFTSSKMKAMFELMEKCADNFTKSFVMQLKNKEEINSKDAFSKYTNDVIATCAFGIEVDSMKDPENEFYTHGSELVKPPPIYKRITETIKFVIIRVFPKLAKKLSLRLIPAKVTDFFIDAIGSVIKKRDQEGITRPDMIQLLMDARGKTSEKVKLDLQEMTAQAFVFFLGGFETTSQHTCLIAHMLATNPQVQEKLHAEIEAVTKETKGKITYDAINHMPYLDAVFQETLRLHPQALFLQRICTRKYELPPTLPGAKPYTIEPNQTILIPVAAIHRDAAYYEEPDKFNPERFLGKNIMTSGDMASLGFGIGPRMCIGNRFAILTIKVMFFYLLSRCKLERCKKTCDPLKYSLLIPSPVPAGGFWLKLSERRSSSDSVS